MQKPSKKRSKKLGLPPETLLYTGDKKDEAVTLHILDYNANEFEEQQLADAEACVSYKNKPTITWINLDGVHKVPLLEKLGDCFGLHRLVVEDIVNTDQRPKMEDYGSYLYLVFKMISSGKGSALTTEQTSIVLGENFVLSFQEGKEGDVFNAVRNHIRSNKGRIRKMTADYLAYSLLDAVVDNYFLVLEKIGDKIEALETELIGNPTQKTVQKIYQIKRELLFLHNAIWPLREAINAMAKHDSPLVRETTAPYLRDLYDHLIHVIDSVDIYREMISSMLDLYLSSVSNRLNSVMKVLTIIATIFMPLTFIVGVYGMNFKYMPERDWEYGYLFVWVLMLGITGFMLYWFKRKKWM